MQTAHVGMSLESSSRTTTMPEAHLCNLHKCSSVVCTVISEVMAAPFAANSKPILSRNLVCQLRSYSTAFSRLEPSHNAVCPDSVEISAKRLCRIRQAAARGRERGKRGFEGQKSILRKSAKETDLTVIPYVFHCSGTKRSTSPMENENDSECTGDRTKTADKKTGC